MPHPPSGRVINYMSNIFYKLRNLLANRVTLVDDPADAWWQYPKPPAWCPGCGKPNYHVGSCSYCGKRYTPKTGVV